MPGADVDLNTASRAIMIAIAINTVSKAIMASWVGNKRVGVLVGGSSVVALAGGLVVAAVV